MWPGDVAVCSSVLAQADRFPSWWFCGAALAVMKHHAKHYSAEDIQRMLQAYAKHGRGERRERKYLPTRGLDASKNYPVSCVEDDYGAAGVETLSTSDAATSSSSGQFSGLVDRSDPDRRDFDSATMKSLVKKTIGRILYERYYSGDRKMFQLTALGQSVAFDSSTDLLTPATETDQSSTEESSTSIRKGISKDPQHQGPHRQMLHFDTRLSIVPLARKSVRTLLSFNSEAFVKKATATTAKFGGDALHSYRRTNSDVEDSSTTSGPPGGRRSRRRILPHEEASPNSNLRALLSSQKHLERRLRMLPKSLRGSRPFSLLAHSYKGGPKATRVRRELQRVQWLGKHKPQMLTQHRITRAVRLLKTKTGRKKNRKSSKSSSGGGGLLSSGGSDNPAVENRKALREMVTTLAKQVERIIVQVQQEDDRATDNSCSSQLRDQVQRLPIFPYLLALTRLGWREESTYVALFRQLEPHIWKENADDVDGTSEQAESARQLTSRSCNYSSATQRVFVHFLHVLVAAKLRKVDTAREVEESLAKKAALLGGRYYHDYLLHDGLGVNTVTTEDQALKNTDLLVALCATMNLERLMGYRTTSDSSMDAFYRELREKVVSVFQRQHVEQKASATSSATTRTSRTTLRHLKSLFFLAPGALGTAFLPMRDRASMLSAISRQGSLLEPHDLLDILAVAVMEYLVPPSNSTFDNSYSWSLANDVSLLRLLRATDLVLSDYSVDNLLRLAAIYRHLQKRDEGSGQTFGIHPEPEQTTSKTISRSMGEEEEEESKALLIKDVKGNTIDNLFLPKFEKHLTSTLRQKLERTKKIGRFYIDVLNDLGIWQRLPAKVQWRLCGASSAGNLTWKKIFPATPQTDQVQESVDSSSTNKHDQREVLDDRRHNTATSRAGHPPNTSRGADPWMAKMIRTNLKPQLRPTERQIDKQFDKGKQKLRKLGEDDHCFLNMKKQRQRAKVIQSLVVAKKRRHGLLSDDDPVGAGSMEREGGVWMDPVRREWRHRWRKEFQREGASEEARLGRTAMQDVVQRMRNFAG
ncbi:unnamed protein product [Amoebophrya sp. A25]|nr:unnamed protein product [Amoebophrya sp. A25]|eukprot:GSA25T00009594001.1